jgi:hypothetical protein
MLYQVGWTTLPGLGGLSCSDFRAAAAESADNVANVAVDLGSDSERDAFLRELEAEFATRRFTNAADAFDTVKAYVLERAAGRK